MPNQFGGAGRCSSRRCPATSVRSSSYLGSAAWGQPWTSGYRCAARSVHSFDGRVQRATTRSCATGCTARPTTTAEPGPLESLQRELRLPDAPLRIECYDMSHLQGTDYVGSMVVFEDGLPKKSDYRHFRVATVPGNDDYAAMEEVLTRRLTTLLTEEASVPRRLDRRRTTRSASPTRRSCCCSMAASASSTSASGCSRHLGLTDRVPIAALAKSFEEVYRPGDTRARSGCPATPRGSICSSACGTRRTGSRSHTTATLRGKRMTTERSTGSRASGRSGGRGLLEEFGGLAGLREASREVLVGVSWLPDQVGAAVFDGSTPRSRRRDRPDMRRVDR